MSSGRRTIALGGTGCAIAAIGCLISAMSGDSPVPALDWTTAAVWVVSLAGFWRAWRQQRRTGGDLDE